MSLDHGPAQLDLVSDLDDDNNREGWNWGTEENNVKWFEEKKHGHDETRRNHPWLDQGNVS